MKSPCRDCKEAKPPTCREDCEILKEFQLSLPALMTNDSRSQVQYRSGYAPRL